MAKQRRLGHALQPRVSPDPSDAMNYMSAMPESLAKTQELCFPREDGPIARGVR